MPDPAAASRCFRFPGWVLLDTVAQFGRCDNSTTAGTKTSDHRDIKVSFEVADPPAATRCFVDFPDLSEGDSRLYARVIGADGAFVLLSVDFGMNWDGLCNVNALTVKNSIEEDRVLLVLYFVSILSVRQQLMRFEEESKHKTPSYNEIWSLIHSGPTSTLQLNIQQLARCANNNDLRNVGNYAVKILLRASKEMGNLLSRCSWKDPSSWGETVSDNLCYIPGFRQPPALGTA